MGGERAAHYFEYSGELFNDIFAIMFTYIRYQQAQQQIMSALVASERQVINMLKIDWDRIIKILNLVKNLIRKWLRTFVYMFNDFDV